LHEKGHTRALTNVSKGGKGKLPRGKYPKNRNMGGRNGDKKGREQLRKKEEKGT